MIPPDDQLERLLRAAAGQSRPKPTGPAPYGLETRALAAWRAGRTAATGLWDVPLLVRGLLLAGAIMAVSFLPALKASASNPFADFLQLTDSTVPSDDAP